jgi:hypothetical protein
MGLSVGFSFVNALRNIEPTMLNNGRLAIS